jgi:hypothetical protein
LSVPSTATIAPVRRSPMTPCPWIGGKEKGLGPIAGVLGGWGLLLGYMVTGMSTLCRFGIFADMLLAQLEFGLRHFVAVGYARNR